MLHADWHAALRSRSDKTADTGVTGLEDLGLVRFQGPDVISFLQGYLTIDPAELATSEEIGVGAAAPFAICNLKGRVVANGWCYCPGMSPDSDHSAAVDLILHESLRKRLAQFMRAYLAFSKTRLIDLTDDRIILGGYRAEFRSAAECSVVRLDDERELCVAETVAAAEDCWADHTALDEGAWQAQLIRAKLPLVSDPVSETYLPQMLGLERIGAISFDKGCYLGQEVVARAQHRGQIKRGLATLSWDGNPAPQPGEELVALVPTEREGEGRSRGATASGKTVGTVVQTAPQARLCLAVVSKQASGPFGRKTQPQELRLERVS